MQQSMRLLFNRMQAQRVTTWVLFLLPALVIYVVFMAFPLFNSMRLSFYTGSGLVPTEFVGLGNYIELFTNPLWRERFFGAVQNTFLFFAIHMTVQNTAGLFFANLLSSDFKGRNIYRTIIFAPACLSTLVIGFLWTLILNPQWGAVPLFLQNIGLESWVKPWLGDANYALIVIALVSSWQWTGFPTVMFLAGLVSIPEEIIEAARVDGASAWTIFSQIKLPMLMPIIGIVSVLTFVGNFNAFDIIFAMEGSKAEPSYATDLLATFFYRTGIAGEQPRGIPEMGMGASVATLTFLILLIGVSVWLYWSRRRSFDM